MNEFVRDYYTKKVVPVLFPEQPQDDADQSKLRSETSYSGFRIKFASSIAKTKHYST